MADEGQGRDQAARAVEAYKRILAAVLDNRPSGTRLKLAAALGKNRSFVSQITNTNYPIPIPAQHVEIICDVCRLSPAERDAFLEAYRRAHPRRFAIGGGEERTRSLRLTVPDLGDPVRNRLFDEMLADFAARAARYALDSTPGDATAKTKTDGGNP